MKKCWTGLWGALNPDVQRELLKQDPPTFAAACQMAERLARLEAVIEARLPSSNQNPNNTTQTTHITKVGFCQQTFKCHCLTTYKRMETVADIGRISMTGAGHTADQHMADTTTPTIEIKTTMQLCAITVVNLDTLQENAIAIQTTSVEVTFRVGINVAVSSLGLASADNMADWTQPPIQASRLTKTVQQIRLGIHPSQKTEIRNHTNQVRCRCVI